MGAFATQIATAKRLIAAKGATVKLRRYTPGAVADASRPTVIAAPTSTDYTVKAVETMRRRPRAAGPPQDAASELVRVYLVAASGLAITPRADTDRIVIGSAEFAIREVKTTAPDQTPIIHEIEVDQWPT